MIESGFREELLEKKGAFYNLVETIEFGLFINKFILCLKASILNNCYFLEFKQP